MLALLFNALHIDRILWVLGHCTVICVACFCADRTEKTIKKKGKRKERKLIVSGCLSIKMRLSKSKGEHPPTNQKHDHDTK